MARYKVELKAFKTGEWYTKTETDYKNSAYSVALTCSLGRSYRIIDTENDEIIEEEDGDGSMYDRYN